MEKSNDVYRKLQQHLDRFPVGFPATESGVEIRILKYFFNQDEAELASRLSIIPESLENLYPKFEGIDINQNQAEAMLNKLTAKGSITGVKNHKTGKMIYANAMLVIGMIEYQVGRLTEKIFKDFEQYRDEAFGNELVKTKIPQLRTVPIEQSIKVDNFVSTYDDIREIVKAAKIISVANCVCREGDHILHNKCNHMDETCFQLGGAAQLYIDQGLGRKISNDEALEILERAQEEGLVVQPGNSQKPNAICCCCGCACEILATAKRFPKPSQFFATNHFSHVDADSCTGCGDCIDRCPMEAMELVDYVSVVDLDRCIGCGVCVPACPSDAIELKKKDEERVPPVNTADMYMKIMQEKARLSEN